MTLDGINRIRFSQTSESECEKIWHVSRGCSRLSHLYLPNHIVSVAVLDYYNHEPIRGGCNIIETNKEGMTVSPEDELDDAA